MLADEDDTGSPAKDDLRSDDESQVDLANIALMHDGRYKVDEDEDEQIESLDAVRDQEEEEKLWKILGQDNPLQVRVKDEPGLDGPRLSRRRSSEMVQNWSEKIRYRAEWQLPNGPPPEEHFTVVKRHQGNRTLRKNYSSYKETDTAKLADADAGSLTDTSNDQS